MDLLEILWSKIPPKTKFEPTTMTGLYAASCFIELHECDEEIPHVEKLAYSDQPLEDAHRSLQIVDSYYDTRVEGTPFVFEAYASFQFRR